MIKENEKLWASAAHISAFVGIILPFGNILGPGAIFALKKHKSKFITEHAKEALNFQISLSLYIVAVLAVFLFFIITAVVFSQTAQSFAAVAGVILWALAAFLLLASFILVILSAVKAYQGKSFRYPFTIRFIKR